MSAVEETQNNAHVKPVAKTRASAPIGTRALALLSSVRLGVTLLVLLALACLIGMLIMQVNVEGFDKYYAALTPSQKLLYGSLGFFDIYHVWYFNALLLVLSLNIVLASIDRFPTAWTYISRRKLDASAHWLRGQEQHAVLELRGESQSALAERIAAAYKSVGLKTTVTEKKGRTYVFGERGTWNRLGAYAVHVALLTIFLGGFLTAQFGRVGQMPLRPGMAAADMTETVFEIDKETQEFAPLRATFDLPFEVACTDIQQKLIKKDGPITAGNTLDWLTRIRIKDERGEHEAVVHMNNPHDYRGYRFFQASFRPIGMARSVHLLLTPQQGGAPLEVDIPRGGSATLTDGTRIELATFFADFQAGMTDPLQVADSTNYQNPAAQLKVTPPGGGEPLKAYAFTRELPEGAPIAAPVGGYKFRLADFEKVPDMHILSIQKDPGSNIVYLGFGLLGLTLCAVFFFSHQRVWALLEERGPKSYEVILGGNTNRNRQGFEDRFKRLKEAINA